MKIYSLVGKSGAGKSYRAGALCSEYGIDSIIDDGLFIMNGRILAGISAKRQSTKYRAIKTALFTDDQHMRSVAARIEKEKPSSTLIIGTSDKMVDIIAERLGLPAPEIRFDIEDITTPEERVIAYRQRHELGKHVIPVPTFQIKKAFSGYFYHPIRTLRGMADTRAHARVEDFVETSALEESEGTTAPDRPPGTTASAEPPSPDRPRPAAPANHPLWDHSVVRPTYSYLGDFTISDKAIQDIVRFVGDTIDGIREAPLILVHAHREGAIVEIGVVARYGTNILDAARGLQTTAASRIESMTSINVIAVDVEIQRLEM
jgi:uncharacterized alkaline shock family protein YloU